MNHDLAYGGSGGVHCARTNATKLNTPTRLLPPAQKSRMIVPKQPHAHSKLAHAAQVRMGCPAERTSPTLGERAM